VRRLPSQVIGGAVLSRTAALTIGLWERLLKYTLTAFCVTITVALESTNLRKSDLGPQDLNLLSLLSQHAVEKTC